MKKLILLSAIALSLLSCTAEENTTDCPTVKEYTTAYDSKGVHMAYMLLSDSTLVVMPNSDLEKKLQTDNPIGKHFCR